MPDIPHPIDALMEQAGESLAGMRYLECERFCQRAIALARQAGDMDRLARIVMPLEEARRQRRQTAEDAGVTVLAEKLSPGEIVQRHPRGCLMLLAPPFDANDVAAVRELAVQRGLFIETLLMDQPRLKAAFSRAMEEQGDAALAQIGRHDDPAKQVDALLAVIDRIGDHEIAHQRLADAARAAGKKMGDL
ncbi:MAG: hypothetical protein ACYC26_03870 [Phycisphaerales bacterium]